jgi:hypothetical protein|eukprot:SAG25_NODE_3027_length_1262_cov_1.199484_2_plen_71_part_00
MEKGVVASAMLSGGGLARARAAAPAVGGAAPLALGRAHQPSCGRHGSPERPGVGVARRGWTSGNRELLQN